MTRTWLIEPRDGLAFRDGRPNDGRSQSRSLPFPLPQTLAGAVRTRLGSNDAGTFEMEPTKALEIEVAGPLLARRKGLGDALTLLLPAPGDALWFEDPLTKYKEILRLEPLGEQVHRGGDVPKDGWASVRAVGLKETRDGKPPKDVPAYWRWTDLHAWLTGGEISPVTVLKEGQKALDQDRRIHVAIDPYSGTHQDGALFGVSSLVFRATSHRGLEDVAELSLSFQLGRDTQGCELRPGGGHMGGKNQLVTFHEADPALWPECPAAILNHVMTGAEKSRLRLMLVTPGLFDLGWLPTLLLQPVAGIEVKVTPVGAKVDRPLTLSGWDYAVKNERGGRGQPKATRRAVPAGAVYWLEIEGGSDQREAWVRHWWMKAVSDQKQDRSDGFGLAVMGVWA